MRESSQEMVFSLVCALRLMIEPYVIDGKCRPPG